MASISGRTVKQVATGRLARIKKGDVLADVPGAPVIARAASPMTPREVTSDRDLRQIKNRQEAEDLPEGDVRRKRKSSSF